MKIIAERASWLGNDELHYLRTWKDKDLGDLMSLVEDVSTLIDLEVRSDELSKNMRRPKKKG